MVGFEDTISPNPKKHCQTKIKRHITILISFIVLLYLLFDQIIYVVASSIINIPNTLNMSIKENGKYTIESSSLISHLVMIERLRINV